MTLLIPITLAGLAVACSRWPSGSGAREALLRSALLLGAILVVSTETLSAFDAIHARGVTATWGLLAVAATLAAFVARAGSGAAGRPALRTAFPDMVSAGAALAGGTILALTLLIAAIAPPDYVDAMTYHMGRVAHWIQERSVAYYPTGITRQNLMMPFAEYGILHLQLLSGGDRWANLVQWTAFALSGVAVSRVLADLDLPERVQWAGALVAWTTPMAILQASGAQNDLVVACWLLAFLLYLTRVLRDRRPEDVLFCGLALGLALVSKGTAYLYASAMGGVLVVAGLAGSPRRERGPALARVVAVIVIAACLNLGPWLRTLSTHGRPLCCGEDHFVQRFTPGIAATNVLRNVGLHLGAPGLADDVTRAVREISPTDVDDPATTMGRFRIAFSLDEGRAGNLLHLLAAVSVAFGIARSARFRRGPATPWLAVATAGFLALVLPLVWQPWGSRLHTPAFLVLAIPIAIALGAMRPRATAAVLALFALGGLFYAVRNEARPLIPIDSPSILARSRTSQYFLARRAWETDYRHVADFLRASGESEIGLLFDEGDYEYPLWVLIKDDFAGPPRIRHVGVASPPRNDTALPPPALVVTTRAGERHVVEGREYAGLRTFGVLSILRREDASPLGAGQ